MNWCCSKLRRFTNRYFPISCYTSSADARTLYSSCPHSTWCIRDDKVRVTHFLLFRNDTIRPLILVDKKFIHFWLRPVFTEHLTRHLPGAVDSSDSGITINGTTTFTFNSPSLGSSYLIGGKRWAGRSVRYFRLKSRYADVRACCRGRVRSFVIWHHTLME